MKFRVYGDSQSGNCYKVKLLLTLLHIDHHWSEVDILAGDTQTAAFRQLNPAAKIPVLSIDDQVHLSESNAILNYLSEGTAYLPVDRLDRSLVLQWQFFEQYSHEPYIAVARFINRYLGLPEDRREEYEQKQQGGHQALAVMENQLDGRDWLVGQSVSIADISLFAYSHVAEEGGFDLSGYPAICGWIERVRQLPDFIAMGD